MITYSKMRVFLSSLFLIGICVLILPAQYKYVGANACKPCHNTKRQGKQYDIWKDSPHSKAFETLKSPLAQKMKKGAEESKECLECHAIAENQKITSEGVTCESCHGAGSLYKSAFIMRDRDKAIASGLREFKDHKAIENLCIECHNKKSPTYKPFEFNKMWKRIEHPEP